MKREELKKKPSQSKDKEEHPIMKLLEVTMEEHLLDQADLEDLQEAQDQEVQDHKEDHLRRSLERELSR